MLEDRGGIKVGRFIALSAIFVQAPRLVLTLLAADRLPVSAAIERVLLVVSGIGTALVLTGGNLYLAHTAATVKKRRKLLLAFWIGVLGASGTLTVPLLAARLTGHDLAGLMSSELFAWGWAALAAVAHELTAAGCVIADAASASERSGGGSALAAAPVFQPAEQQESLPADSSEPELSIAEPAFQPAHKRVMHKFQRLEESNRLIPCRRGCGRSFRSRRAEAGHQRHCVPPRRRSDETAKRA